MVLQNTMYGPCDFKIVTNLVFIPVVGGVKVIR